jgi:hypothetical protein
MSHKWDHVPTRFSDKTGNFINVGDIVIIPLYDYDNDRWLASASLIQFPTERRIRHFPLCYDRECSHFINIYKFNKEKILKITEEQLSKTEKRNLKLLTKNSEIYYGNSRN